MGGMRGVGSRRHESHHGKGAVRAFPINGGRRGGAAHLLNGAEARSSRRPLPTITGWERSSQPSPRLCTSATCIPCAWAANGGGGKLGRRGLGRRVDSSSLRLPRLDWLSGAAEPPPRSFIKSGRGDRVPHSFISSFLQLLLPPSIRHGERESWSFNGGGAGRRSTTRSSFSCTRDGRASREGKGEGARPRRSGKRRTGRRASLASASSSSPRGGPPWG